MVTSIQLGNFFSSGGKTVLGGVGGSGLDTESLVKGLTDAKGLPAKDLQTKIDKNDKVSAALKEFQTLLSTLKDSVSFMRNPPGVSNQAQNGFAYTTANVISNSSALAGNYLSVQTSPGVSSQNFVISDIASVAKAKQQATGNITFISPATTFNADSDFVTATSTPNRFKAGTVQINGTSLTFEAGDSLNEVASKFNAVKASTGISATVIKVSDNNYRLVYSSTTTGTDADFNLNDAGTVTDSSGVFSLIGRTNLLTNGTFTSDITSWTNASQGTAEGISYSSGKLQLNGEGTPGNEAFAQQAMTTVPGQTYTVRATFAGSPNGAAIRIGSGNDVTLGTNYDIANQSVNADGETMFTFVATGTTTYLTFDSGAGTSPITVDDVVVTANATNGFNTLQSASDAEFTLNGVAITRQTNAVSDVVSGVTFNILQETPDDTELSATIVPDTSTAKNAIINFINAYNDMRIFAAKQMQVGNNGQYTDDAVLSSNSTFRNTVSTITNTLTQVISGITNGDPNRLSELGITFADLPESKDNPLVRNILDVNDGTLTSKLADSFDALKRVFEFDFSSTNPNLRVFSRTNALSASDFSLTISSTTPPTLPTAIATYTGGTANFDVAAIKDNATGDTIGYTLTGQKGTVFEGLVLLYSSTTGGTMTAKATQGLADKLYNTADDVLKKDTGAMDVELASIKSADERLQNNIDKINEQVERFRQSLLDKFGALEQAIARVNTILQSIDAQNQARYNS